MHEGSSEFSQHRIGRGMKVIGIMKRGDRVRVKQLANIAPSLQLRNGVVIADSSLDGSTQVKFDDETAIHVFRKEELEQEADL